MAISARIDELKKKFDENPRRYFASLANEYRKSGDLDQALFICQEYLPQQPGHMSGHIVYAQTLYEMGRYDDARAEFESALALDPENLIALRHLGDIARQAGDVRLARGWYQRVLEADPRNGEIAELLATIRTTPLSSPQVSPYAPPTPISSAAYVPPTAPEVAPSAETEDIAEPVHDATDEDVAHDELLDFESIQIGATPLSSAVVHEESSHESQAFATPTNEPSDTPEVGDAHGVFDAEAFEADVFAIATPAMPATPVPEIPLATDVNLGLIDEETPPTTTESVTEPIAGLRSYEPGVVFDTRDHVAAEELETEPFYDVFNAETPAPESQAPAIGDDSLAADNDTFDVDSLAVDAASDSAVEPVELVDAPPGDAIAPTSLEQNADAPSFGATPASSEIFVTETMAELYLQQGHHDSALEIYRKLLDSRPDDAMLADRVRSIEAQMRPTSRSETPADDSLQAASTSATAALEHGPTIRDFLVNLVAVRRTVGAPSALPEVAAHSDHATESSAPGGSIDALFPSHETSAADSEAATALADAFSEGDFGSPITGLPSHQAEDELSLDQVFKAGTPPRAESPSGGFSFDQFFAGEAKRQTPTDPSVGGGAPPVEGADDVAQFNAWLNGLKKT